MDAKIIEHGEVTDSLATALRELGFLKSAVITEQLAVWQQTDHLNITERRETIRYSTTELHRQIALLEGEIDAHRATLKHLELLIANG